MHLGHDIDPRTLVTGGAEHGAAIGAQGDVEHRPLLGDVDPLAPEHRVATLHDTGGSGHGEQGDEDSVVDALLRVVDA